MGRRALWRTIGLLALALGGADGAVAAVKQADPAMRTYTGHTAGVNRVVWHPDGLIFASTSDDKTAIVWDAHYGTVMAKHTAHTAPVVAIAYDPSGTALLTGDNAGVLHLWVAQSGAKVRRFTAHGTGAVTGLAYNPADENQFVATTADGLTVLYNKGVADTAVWTSTRFADSCLGPAFNPANSAEVAVLGLLAGSAEVHFLDAATGRDTRSIPVGPGAGACTSIAYNPKNPKEILVGCQGQLRAFDVTTGTEVVAFPGLQTEKPLAITFSTDGNLFATTAPPHLWSRSTASAYEVYGGHSGVINDVVFNPINSDEFLTASADTTLKLFSVAGAVTKPELGGVTADLIVGIVLGGLVIIGLIALAMYLTHRSKQQLLHEQHGGDYHAMPAQHGSSHHH